MSEPIRIVGFISVGGDGVRWVDDEGVTGPVQIGLSDDEVRQRISELPNTSVTLTGVFGPESDAPSTWLDI